MTEKQHGGRRPGAGRPQVYASGTMRTVAIRMPDWMLDRLMAVSAERKTTVSALVREAVGPIVERSE